MIEYNQRMEIKRAPLLVPIIMFLVFGACSRQAGSPSNTNLQANNNGAARPHNSVDFVKATAGQAEIRAGGTGEATVHLTIENGYHVNANPPTFPYLKPTTVTIPNADGFTVAFIKYPNAVTKKFSFADQPLSVYEGQAEIKVSLKTAPTVSAGPHQLPATLGIQACDDQVCYAPGTIALSVPVVVK